MTTTLEALQQKVIAFRDERDWEQFHKPKDLALGLQVEAAELVELFLWGSIHVHYSGTATVFLDFVLDHYVTEGVSVLDDSKLRHLIEIKYHSSADAVPELGEPSEIRELFVGFQRYLFGAGQGG